VDVTRLSNRELIAHLVQAGPEDAAWQEFLTRFERRIRLTTYRAFRIEAQHHPGVDVDRTGEMVGDLTQEVLLRLLDSERKALASFKGRSENSIYTYLNTIATNLVRDHFKKLRAQKTPPAAASLDEPTRTREGAEGRRVGDLVASRDASPEHSTRGKELRRRIGDVISRFAFPKRDRLVFRFYFLEGRTIDEVAACRSIGLSASGVEKCIRRLRTAVQRELAWEARDVAGQPNNVDEGGQGVKNSSSISGVEWANGSSRPNKLGKR
jgi:RNA polymerase sigma factor (sigma-70 family)